MAGMADAVGLIFANMHDLTVTDLTKTRTMGSVPFGARYRLIDFPLSNMVNSGVSAVGVIARSNYQSLLDHLGSGGEWDLSRKTGGLRLLPPYGRAADFAPVSGLIRGRLEALSGVIQYIRNAPSDYVIMSDCDVIANIDLKAVLEYHVEKGADITVVYGRGKYAEGELRTKTVLNVNQDDLVYDVLIRPETGGEVNASMNMFVIEKEFLLEVIEECASRNLYSFEIDVIQHRCKELKIYGYKYDGYYSQIDSIITYFDSNMALMDLAVRNGLFSGDGRPVYTKVRDEAPAKYGLEACVTNSLVADGCIIDGYAENCVLFRGVKVGKGAVVKNCVLMQDSVVGEKCEMNYVISDKDVKVGSYRSLFGTKDYPVFVGKGASV
ncbi:MAG: glucose-1-phosphate adenylyltransferase subunit GlgD [Oscillospiraceae bacterium]|jgi:glucose-1-phosphate adenylyltransferase|nr:glucose-1-phosphate adenylyltransferase subunit GlgD [Oscillospiraceae bacterium]